MEKVRYEDIEIELTSKTRFPSENQEGLAELG